MWKKTAKIWSKSSSEQSWQVGRRVQPNISQNPGQFYKTYFHYLHISFIFSHFSNVSLCLSCHWLQQRTSDNQDKVKHSKRMKIQCQCLGCHLLPVCHIIIHFSSEHDPDKLQGRPNQAAEICCRVTGINTSMCWKESKNWIKLIISFLKGRP